MDLSKFVAQRSVAAQKQKLDPTEERLRAAHVKQHGYPKDSTLPALIALWVKAKSAEHLARRAAYHHPPGKKNHKPSKAALRLHTQARIDTSEKHAWLTNFLKSHGDQKPDFATVQGNFFIGVNEFLKSDVGSSEEKEALGLLMMAKRIGAVIYPEQSIMGELGHEKDP